MKIDEAVELIGEFVNGQLTYTWDTRQTLEQFVEIRTDSGESEEFDLDDFIEYVVSNVYDILAEDAGRHSIRGDIYVIDQYGTPLEEK